MELSEQDRAQLRYLKQDGGKLKRHCLTRGWNKILKYVDAGYMELKETRIGVRAVVTEKGEWAARKRMPGPQKQKRGSWDWTEAEIMALPIEEAQKQIIAEVVRRKLKVKEISRISGVEKRNIVTLWANDKHRPQFKTVCRMAKALGGRIVFVKDQKTA
jgi:hypothetical protein